MERSIIPKGLKEDDWFWNNKRAWINQKAYPSVGFFVKIEKILSDYELLKRLHSNPNTIYSMVFSKKKNNWVLGVEALEVKFIPFHYIDIVHGKKEGNKKTL